MPKISVIIPVYNAEKYLTDCLNSLIHQTFQDWEAICVNDGSSDGSRKILESFSKRDKRIKVINQKNSGVSVARNKGIQKATGEFLTFVDSDDLLHSSFLKITHQVFSDSTDCVSTGYRFFDEEKPSFESFKRVIFQEYTHVLIRYLWHLSPFRSKKNDKKLKKNCALNHMVWGKLYRTEKIKRIEFLPNVSRSEDFLFFLSFLMQKPRIRHISIPLYFYRDSENSLTRRTFSDKMIEDGIKIFEEMIKQLQKSQLPFYQKILLRLKCQKKCFRSIYHYPVRKAPVDQLFYYWDKFQGRLKELEDKGLFHPFYLNFYHLFLYILYKKRCYRLLKKILVKKKK